MDEGGDVGAVARAGEGDLRHGGVGAVARVGEVAADDIPPTTHAVPLTNVLRPDAVRPSLPREAVLAAAPAAEDGRFRVPRILDEDA
jgi:aspartyl-tRNA(Asn)/glutamyl-tRNA(Gln) amidotransferase subunit C